MFKPVIAAFCCVLAAGCATVPTEQADGVSLAAVEERVKCEIGRAYRNLSERRDPYGKQVFPDLSRWAAGVTLSLAVDTTGGANASSLVGPFGSLSPLEFGAGASLNAKRTGLFNVYTAFAEAALHHCRGINVGILLEGNLGLAEWIERVFESQLAAQRAAEQASEFGQLLPFNGKDKSIGYSLAFLTTLNAGATPNFIFSGGTAKSVLAFETKLTHSLDIAMLEMTKGDFERIFETVHIPAVTKRVPNTDPNTKGIHPLTVETIKPARTEKRYVGRTGIGLVTKDRLDSVLQQLNNKTLIQTLRR
ncbi:hypothetical protein [Bradyrhizobium sp. JYMT SZCCT0428]|uniref:hypothetical protein n=1 Tax=Bradyrhizobium sp. JYMT SZCCT0428 TaxID=2807673 RepID=UPI001BAA07A2|nr:hypothetical protein [Bradyrhizobium sp. JYMT SZCCT0428]MBR1152514.1 hypothetical protein [Bradyrhizobium sp. JYMT SZCCT0428]